MTPHKSFYSLAIASILAIGGTVRVSAQTMYDAKIDTTLTLNTPVQVNTFGWATFAPQTDGGTLAFLPPNATASSAVAATNRPSNPMHHVIEVKGGTAGVVNDFEFADSWGETSQNINLANLTGSGGPTPPAQTLDVSFTLSTSWDLSASVTDPTCEVAGAAIHYEVYFNPGILLGSQKFLYGTQEVQAPPNGALMGTFTDTFTVHVYANSIASVGLHTWAVGYGESDCTLPIMPPPPPIPLNPPYTIFTPVPEPGTYALATGLALPYGIFVLRRTRRAR